MRYLSRSVALVAFLVLATTSFAADPSAPPAAAAQTPAERHNILHGVVKSVDGKSITVAVGRDENAKEIVVVTDDNTRFTIDHEPGTLDNVKVGEVIAVGPDQGVAHHVDINTTHKEGDRHNVLHGIVRKVDGKTITVEIGKGDRAKEVTVETDASTKFTVDHEPAKLEDVKEGELIAVGPASGVAHHVDLNTSHKGSAD